MTQPPMLQTYCNIPEFRANKHMATAKRFHTSCNPDGVMCDKKKVKTSDNLSSKQMRRLHNLITRLVNNKS